MSCDPVCTVHVSDPFGSFAPGEFLASFLFLVALGVAGWLMGRVLKFTLGTWLWVWVASFFVFLVSALSGRAFALWVMLLSVVMAFIIGMRLAMRHLNAQDWPGNDPPRDE